MTKAEIISMFCSLSAMVSAHMKDQFAYDCFCVISEERKETHSFHFSWEIYDFIAGAVREKIAKESA